ncbi:hypothetical protein V5O48_018411, partial [Marasmius crinis-equi]
MLITVGPRAGCWSPQHDVMNIFPATSNPDASFSSGRPLKFLFWHFTQTATEWDGEEPYQYFSAGDLKRYARACRHKQQRRYTARDFLKYKYDPSSLRPTLASSTPHPEMKSFAAVLAIAPLLVAADHQFTLRNNCPNAVNAVIADTRCGFSPRCDDATSFTGAQPGSIASGTDKVVTIPSSWVGRIFAQTGSCGEKGDGCTVTEFNLDSGDQFTPQSYDISNIQGFTQSVSIAGAGCEQVTCTNVNCGCTNAFPPGDISGCGNDSPVRGCGAGDVGFT